MKYLWLIRYFTIDPWLLVFSDNSGPGGFGFILGCILILFQLVFVAALVVGLILGHFIF